MTQSHPDLELVSFHLCPYVQRAVITLTEKEIPHRRTYIDLSDKPGWFKEISPLGKVPLLRAGDAVLFESAVICEYLDEVTPGTLHPDDPLEKARHRSWIEFGSSILDAIAGFYSARDADGFARKRQVLVDKFAWLERHLGGGPYFAGARFHLVDAVYATVFRYFDTFDRIADFGVFDATPKLRAYRVALAERPSVRTAVTPDYPAKLMDFVRRRGSYLSSRLPEAA
ncbi:MAG: glutathione S-transferase family protein [Alphaproteobacteria bacterium]|nr:glutathione S-transferase family protein [Alphaproteobacteria bacterium]